ncbi:MAG: glycine betaine ABC transporter substrate-binding protein [Planctomycetota bacterium]
MKTRTVVTIGMIAGALLFLGFLLSSQRGNRDSAAPMIVTGSKMFAESLILGELAAIAARESGYEAIHNGSLGGTAIVFRALEEGEIDIYADYTGTLIYETLANEGVSDFGSMRSALAVRGIGVTEPLGFNNSYGVAMLGSRAEELGVRTISDFAKLDRPTISLTPESADRADVWPGIRETYGLPIEEPTILAHELSYRAVVQGEVDAMNVYTTDAKIAAFDFRVLEDDRKHFREYQAIYLYRLDLAERAPGVIEELNSYAGFISNDLMIEHNSLVEIDARAPAFTAEQLDASIRGRDVRVIDELTMTQVLWKRTQEHLWLTVVSMALATIIALPAGVLAAKRPSMGLVVLGIAGVIFTIPSLALLAFFIRPLGLGSPPAIAALTVYALLPMIRSTQVGLASVDRRLIESAEALGMGSTRRLFLIEIPIASRSIIAGIKTATVITIGFAALGAFIGAGGLGEPILTGLRQNRFDLLYAGAGCAAALALAAHGLFDLLERLLIPRGLRA